MAVNFPRFQTFDYGRAMQTKQQIGYNKMRNEATGMDLEQHKDMLANRKRANEIREQIERMPEQIAEMERQGLYDEADRLRSSYIDTRFNEVKLIEAMREGINADNYKQFRSDMHNAGAADTEKWPTEYDDGWFRKKRDEVKNKLSVQTRRWAEQGSVFSQDFISDEFGEINWTGEPYLDPSKQKGAGRSGKPWQMTSGDTNSIRNAAAQLYGTMWDPITSQYQGLNKEQSKEIASITELASKIYNANKGQLGHGIAVARAARQKGIDINEMRTPGGGFNPLDLPGIEPPARPQ